MPAINPLPTPPSRNDPANFSDRADAFLAALPAYTSEANALLDDVHTSRDTVQGLRNEVIAAGLENAAANAATAATKAAEAASSASEAFGYLQAYRATSYGALAADPVVDPNGNPPTVGDEYFNTSMNLLKRFNGVTWQASDIATADLASPGGSAMVGYDGGTAQDVLDGAKPMANYTALRNYTGRATGVRITQTGLAGFFQRDAGDTTSTDNGGTIIVGPSGRRWKRIFSGAVNVKWFGALGNSNGSTGNGNDDHAGIQSALNCVEAMGGGTVDLPQSTGHYRIAQGLKIGSFVTLQGPGVNRYPYNDDASCIVEDFSDPMQWMLEPKTTVAGSPVGYNTIITAFPTGPTYNCAVRDVQLRSNKATGFAFGGIRMHGCPGSVISNVSVVGTGIGALINECYGGSYDLQTLTHYYGVAAWQEVNACHIKAYSGSLDPAVKTVPAGYLLSFMEGLSASLTGGTYVLSTNAHYNRCWGMIIGANSGDLSVGNTVDLTAEQFSGACLQLFTSATNFIRFYEEGAAGNVDFGFVAAQSKSFCGNFHAFHSSSGALFDIGAQSSVAVQVNGLFNYATFGTVYLSPNTSLMLSQCKAADFGATLPTQYNVSVSDDAGEWIAPALLNSWANVGGVTTNYRRNGRNGNIEIKGRVGGGPLNNAIFNLPAGSRPGENRLFAVASNNGAALGAILVNTAGDVIPTAGTTSDISLAGISFQAEA